MTVGKYSRKRNDLNVVVPGILATEGITVDKIRVVLADDHREVIAKIRGMLGGTSSRSLRQRRMAIKL